jgi:hypothetical protein
LEQQVGAVKDYVEHVVVVRVVMNLLAAEPCGT